MIEFYPIFKHLHMGFALLSIVGLLFRVGLKWRQSPLLTHKLCRIAPHVNDSLLLLFGILMAVTAQINPMQHLWLAGKLVLLVLYILCGMYALKWSRTRAQLLSGTALAMCCFVGIAWLARVKDAFL